MDRFNSEEFIIFIIFIIKSMDGGGDSSTDGGGDSSTDGGGESESSTELRGRVIYGVGTHLRRGRFVYGGGDSSMEG
jgi:hypothetical protein